MSSKQPNIIIICTDQQRLDSLSCYGNPFMQTPGFDFVAKHGVRFDRAYCTSAVCTPSRVSLLNGQYVSRHGVWNVGVNAGEDVTLLSHRLGEAGYQTCLVGKAHFEAYHGSREQSKESVDAFAAGYEGWLGPYYGFEQAKLALGHTAWGMNGHYGAWLREHFSEEEVQRFKSLKQVDNGPEFGGNAYDWDLPVRFHNSVWTVDTAIEFLKKERTGSDPFFTFVSFQDPHHPHAVPVDYENRVETDRVPPPSFSECELDDKPPHFGVAHCGELGGSRFTKRWMMSGQGVGFDYRNISETAQQLGRSYYYSMVKLMDDQLMRFWRALEAQNLLEDTIIMVTTDHGELLGDHGLWMKGPFHYEQLLRVPLMVMGGERFRGGAADQSVVSLADIVPTCLTAAGVDYDPDEMDGENLLNGSEREDRSVLCETILDWQGLICRTVVNGRYKMTWYANEDFGELFDLQGDPRERRNRWSDKDCREIRLAMLSDLVNKDTKMHASLKERIAYA